MANNACQIYIYYIYIIFKNAFFLKPLTIHIVRIYFMSIKDLSRGDLYIIYV